MRGRSHIGVTPTATWWRGCVRLDQSPVPHHNYPLSYWQTFNQFARDSKEPLSPYYFPTAKPTNWTFHAVDRSAVVVIDGREAAEGGDDEGDDETEASRTARAIASTKENFCLLTHQTLKYSTLWLFVRVRGMRGRHSFRITCFRRCPFFYIHWLNRVKIVVLNTITGGRPFLPDNLVQYTLLLNRFITS